MMWHQKKTFLCLSIMLLEKCNGSRRGKQDVWIKMLKINKLVDTRAPWSAAPRSGAAVCLPFTAALSARRQADQSLPDPDQHTPRQASPPEKKMSTAAAAQPLFSPVLSEARALASSSGVPVDVKHMHMHLLQKDTSSDALKAELAGAFVNGEIEADELKAIFRFLDTVAYPPPYPSFSDVIPFINSDIWNFDDNEVPDMFTGLVETLLRISSQQKMQRCTTFPR